MKGIDMDNVQFFSRDNAINVTKENKTIVDYFIFDEFEIHMNKIPSKTIQEWHIHKLIEEIIVVTSGEICVKWKVDDEIYNKIVTAGSIIRMNKSIHTVENNTNDWADFIVFRMVPSGTIQREVIKNDKVIISDIL